MKVGDKVAVINRAGRLATIVTIRRETELYWIISVYGLEHQFCKKDLTCNDEIAKGARIEPVTKAHIDELRKRNIVKKLSTKRWETLDLETLEKVFAIVCGMTETKETGK